MRASWWNPGVMGLLGAVAFVSTNVECTGDDKDKDGIGSFADNCPDVANASQADTDGDRIGDACDKCPTEYAETSPDGCPVAEEHCSDAVDDDGDALVDCDDPDCSEDPLCQGQGGGGSGGGGAGGGGQGGGGAGGGGAGGGGAGGGGAGGASACFLGDSCALGDPVTCTCNGCPNELCGGANSDCLCGICDGDPGCSSCNDDGVCSPSSEGCGCADCQSFCQGAP